MITLQSRLSTISSSVSKLPQSKLYQSTSKNSAPNFKTKIIKTNEIYMSYKFSMKQFLKDYKSYEKYKIIKKLFDNASSFEEHDSIKSEYDEINLKIIHFEAYYAQVLIYMSDNKLKLDRPVIVARIQNVFEGVRLNSKTFLELMSENENKP